jgi:hypothetical protein
MKSRVAIAENSSLDVEIEDGGVISTGLLILSGSGAPVRNQPMRRCV